MLDAERPGDMVTDVAVLDQIQKICFYLIVFDVPVHFQAALCHGTDGAAGRMFKNQTRYYSTAVNDGFDIIDRRNLMPLHVY